MRLSLIGFFLFLIATPAFALESRSMKIGAGQAHLWWTMECTGPICGFQEIIQPMTEAGADVLNSLDESKAYTCNIKSRRQWAPDEKKYQLAYEISDCVE